MDYNAPSGSTDANAGYVGKTASTQGSKVPPKALEYPQREIVGAIKSSGQTPSNGDLTQLWKAIQAGGQSGAKTTLANLSVTGGRQWIKRSAGTYTLKMPDDVSKVYARAKGAGGKGGDSSYAGNVSSGGAGGGVDEGVFDVVPGSTLTAVVGIGGRPGAPAGATTSITGLYRNGAPVTLYATGGGAGTDGYNGAQQQIPTGGQGYGGDNPRPGQFGGVGLAMKSDNGATLFAGGVGGAAGIEGATTIFALNNGIPGSNPGDGGSGANNAQVGGAGADGEAMIKY